VDEAELVARAARRRAALAHDEATTAYRVINGVADGVAGMTVDRYGDALVANLYDENAPRSEQAVIAALATLPRVRAIYVKRRPRSVARLSAAQVAALAPAALPSPRPGQPAKTRSNRVSNSWRSRANGFSARASAR